MTLDTRVYVHDEMDPRELHRKCNVLLGAEDARSSDEPQKRWRDGESYPDPSGRRDVSNHPGQGFSAWLMVHYRPGQPLRTDAESAEHDDLCDDDCTETQHRTPCWLEVSFDTTYGYKDDQGRGCGDLHACLVSDLGQWLDERGIRWSWKNEFTGEVHTGYDRLIELVSDGFQASAWFRTSALPAILSHATEGRS